MVFRAGTNANGPGSDSVNIMRYCLPLCFCLAAAVALSACGERPEILLGFSGQLTGISSDLGVQGRNGATLAVEDVNAGGGVAGRRLKLLAEDDGNTPEGARRADEKLLDSGVVAVVGHMTSAQTLAVIDLFEARRAVLVSPTTATPSLTGKVDQFFRVIPDNRSWGVGLAEYLASHGPHRVFVLGDSDNASYVDAFNSAFVERFTRDGRGHVVGREWFSSRAGPDWSREVKRIRQSGARGVVLAASARDVAAFAKANGVAGTGLAIFCPTWAYTREILLAGGPSVDGIVFSTCYTEENPSPSFKTFAARYEQRFGWPPNFAAAYAYEAVMLLAKALEKTGGLRQGLESALVSLGPQAGVVGTFSLDAYGDVQRESFLVTIENGRFQNVDHDR